jgi:hypothetical protein
MAVDMDYANGTMGDLLDRLVAGAFDYTRRERKCPGPSDRDLVREGVLRVLSHADSGRDWLQRARETGCGVAARGTLFPALHSERRRGVVQDVGGAMTRRAARELAELGVDHLADFGELAPYRCLAADGHTIAHACHAERRARGRSNPVSCIYALDLRSGLARAFAPVSGDGRRRHEWPVFEQALLALVHPRDGGDPHEGAEGTIHVLDRAYIDNQFWSLDAERARHYVVTRMKSNMQTLMRAPQQFDCGDPVNAGVLGFYHVGFNNASTMYLVEYEDPETAERHDFLSAVPGIRPGLVAWLYFLRWRIEKMFDTFKNDFGEAKAWANGESANAIQAACIAMAYCFCRILERRLGTDHGLADQKVARKHARQLDRRERQAGARGRSLHPLHRMTAPRRMAKLSAQFVRTVRNHLFIPRTLRSLLALFAAAFLKYH